MIDTSTWPSIKLGVLKDIHLDARNVRLENASARVEADIMEDLFTNEGALSLVEGIARVGYLTHETPIVLKRASKYVVVEGNRRVAALKAIQNPLLVPTHQARISALVKEIPDIKQLATISVLIAPNQDLANQLIATIHTSNLRKPWSPSRQAAFFQAQVDAGRTLAQLLERYPTIDVRQFVLRSQVFKLLADIPYDDSDLQDFTLSKDFKKASSTLSRIYEAKEFVDIVGLKLDEKGNVSTSLNSDELKHVATVIVSGIKDGSLDTRSLNSVGSPRFKQLLEDVKGGGTKGKPATGRQSKAQGAGSKVTPPKKKEKSFLDFSQVAMPDSFPVAVQLHLQELSALNFRVFPNTAFLALRALLEKTIKAFADSVGEDIKSKSNNNGYVQLNNALDWLEAYFKTTKVTALVQPTRKFRTGQWVTYATTNDALNASNHNHKFSVDGDDVLNCWQAMEPIMREITKS